MNGATMGEMSGVEMGYEKVGIRSGKGVNTGLFSFEKFSLYGGFMGFCLRAGFEGGCWGGRAPVENKP